MQNKVRWRGWVLGLASLFGAGFLVLTRRALKLPAPRGSGFLLKQEMVRYGAVATGVVFLLLTMAVLLPWIFDRLERGVFVSFVSTRHVRASKSGFLTVISILSISGVAVSSCSLCMVTSVMGGFGQDLKRKILGNNAHIVIDSVESSGGIGDWDGVLDRVRLAPGIAAATPAVWGEGMASSSSNTAGALVRGIDTETIGSVIDLVKNIEVGKFEYLDHPDVLTRLPADEVIGLSSTGEPYLKGPDLSAGDIDPVVRDALQGPPTYPGVVIGSEIAKTLHAFVGDEITLISPLGDLGPIGVLPRARKFRVAAIFHSGMYEYDATHVYMKIDVAQAFFSMKDKISAIEVKAVDAERAMDFRDGVEHAVDRPALRVRDWREINKNLFSALKLEKIATFLVLLIAIIVACFCIICTLLLMVTEKGKEIAVLKALGASDDAIMRVFMAEGILIGAIGTVFGVVTGLASCLGLSWFGVRLDPDVYYIDRLPIAVSPADYVTVAVAALVICTLSTLYPAWAASRLRPVDGLRYS